MQLFGDIGVADYILPLSESRLFSSLRKEAGAPLICEEYRAEFLSAAEAAYTAELPRLSASLFLKYTKDGDRAAFENAYFTRRRIALLLAAGVYFGREEYAGKLIDTLWEIVEESSWVLPANIGISQDGSGLSRDTGAEIKNLDPYAAATAAALGFCVTLAGAAIDKTEPRTVIGRIRYETERRVFAPFLRGGQPFQGEDGKRRLTDRTPFTVVNVLTAAALLVPDSMKRGEIAARGALLLDRFVSFYSKDGGCDEGAFYWERAAGATFLSLEILADMSDGRLDAFGIPLVRKIGEYIVKMHITRRRFVNCADCPGTVYHDTAMLRRFGERTGSGALVKLAATLDAAGTNAGQRLEYGGSEITNMPYEFFAGKAAPSETGGEKFEHYDYYYLPDIEVVNMRDEGTFLSVKGGNNGEGHNHNDAGNIIVYFDGSPLIVDAGVGEYTKDSFGAGRYEIWYNRSAYHNLPMFDGCEQAAGRQYAASDIVADRDAKRVALELAGAYPSECGVVSSRRCVELNRGQVELVDSVELLREEEITLCFLTAQKPQTDSAGKIRFSLDGGKSAYLAYPENMKCEADEIDLRLEKHSVDFGKDMLWRIRLSIRAKSVSIAIQIGKKE